MGMHFIDRIWRELDTPDSAVVPSRAYIRAVVGIGHAMLGAVIGATLGLYGLGAAVVVALAYWLWKERGDLRRGGTFWDGAEDTAFVALGLWYGAVWWPAVVMAAAGYVLAVATWRAK